MRSFIDINPNNKTEVLKTLESLIFWMSSCVCQEPDFLHIPKASIEELRKCYVLIHHIIHHKEEEKDENRGGMVDKDEIIKTLTDAIHNIKEEENRCKKEETPTCTQLDARIDALENDNKELKNIVLGVSSHFFHLEHKLKKIQE